MTVAEDIADELAQTVVKIIQATGDDQVVSDIAKVIGASSQTMEEAFLTAVRVRRAELRARAMLRDKLKQIKAAAEADKPEQSGGTD